jgi:hypothetical protein
MIRDPVSQAAATGASEKFDIVILTVGFGIERDGTISDWRNEESGQPSLNQPRRTYLISGQGDGAMIDLLRLRISQYRQDRILDELFHGKTNLFGAIREMHSRHSDSNGSGLFDSLEALSKKCNLQIEFQEVTEALTRRLRRDTDVILYLRVKKISELFDPVNTRISFQNKLLVYLPYKCGGFIPSSLNESFLITQYSIASGNIVRRHGTLRDEQLQRILSTTLFKALQKRRGSAIPDPLSQPDHVIWSGGYFDLPGPLEHTAGPDDPIREHWCREYLPGPTALLATAFCSGLAGMLRTAHPAAGRLRVTLHRAITVGNEELLQQICDYQGTDDARGLTSSAARTFPAKNATIGLAYRCRQIIRSVKGIKADELRSAMDLLNLNTASRSMAADVRFVLAIPILEPEEDRKFTAPNPVVGVIYVDSKAEDFFIDDEELGKLVSVTQHFIDGIEQSKAKLDRIRNIPLTGLGTGPPAAENIPGNVSRVLEIVRSVRTPLSRGPLQLNFDYSDFVPV